MSDGSRSMTLMVSSLVAELADLEPGQHGLQRTAHGLRRDSEGPSAVLVDLELQARYRLEPVVVHVADAEALARITSPTRQRGGGPRRGRGP